MNHPHNKPTPMCPRKTSRLWKACMLIVMLNLFSVALLAGAEPPVSEYKVKALFLVNFAKYVDWPAEVFPDTNAPITIGVVGKDRFGGELDKIIDGKTVNGRSFVIKHINANDGWTGCQILFISHSEAARAGEILGKTGTLPVLTVGEDSSFEQKGGMVTFMLKNEKVRLEINLDPANKCGLKISSRLLAVADVVKGKAD